MSPLLFPGDNTIPPWRSNREWPRSPPEAIGQDLGTIGPEKTVDLSSLKPVLAVALQAGRPNLGWVRQGIDGVEISVDRGNGRFGFLSLGPVPDYLNATPLPAPGVSAVWQYQTSSRLQEEQIVWREDS